MDETESIETKGPNDRRVVAERRREGWVGGEARTNEEVSVSAAAAEKCIQRCIGDAVAKAVTNRILLRFKNNSLLETKRLSICPCQRRHVSMYGSRN